MMFGYSDEWWVVFFAPMILWIPFGPFVMCGMGVCCALRPGWRAGLWSVLLPLLPTGVGLVIMLMPWSEPTRTDDLIGFLGGYVLGITVTPWVLGYGTTRAVRAVRSARARRKGSDGGADAGGAA
ncbi:hypothetical protein AB0F25_38205 [Streptomyces wedmorensis]|uniref:hypothetical protein n=1 Tax=Streptomyces wedmorensis TaxID=43759 RepID=UPI00342120F6